MKENVKLFKRALVEAVEKKQRIVEFHLLMAIVVTICIMLLAALAGLI